MHTIRYTVDDGNKENCVFFPRIWWDRARLLVGVGSLSELRAEKNEFEIKGWKSLPGCFIWGAAAGRTRKEIR